MATQAHPMVDLGFQCVVGRRVCRRSAGVLLLLLLCFALFPSYAHALPKDDGGEGPPDCEPGFFVDGRLVVEGVHLDQQIVRMRSVQIAAVTLKVVEQRSNCSVRYYGLPPGAFSWLLPVRPTGSSAVLSGASTLTATLTPDVNGDYTVRLVGCPGGCNVLGNPVQETVFDLTLTAVDSIALPPAMEPVVPPMLGTSPSSIPDADEKCLGGGGVVDPQWVTVNQWTGAESYELLEGSVEKSRVSRKDNPLNHDSQDHLFHLRPDVAYRRLLRGSQQLLEIEWERSHFPEPFRPTPGDRASVYGFWILDCGHDGPTEIHPPVGVAIHRPRAIAIDPTVPVTYESGDDVVPFFTSTVGSNVYVPGIVTDIYFSQQAGEITGNCSATGLHQPGHYLVTPQGVQPVTGACIRSPHPLNRIFTFNIYLPPQPQLGTSNDVPLYVKIEPHPFGFSTGPDPQITLVGTAPNRYLRVSIDLRSFAGTKYTRRILAGWALASPDNWGLQRWKVRLNNVDVHDDGDGILRGDGDWRFWLNTNNGYGEWTKLFDCDGCVHGRETFGGRPWQTGDSSEVAVDRSLGPDVLRFPLQRIWVHTSGFEADTVVDDDTGSVNDLRPQLSRTYATRSYCEDQTISGCASYTLNYEIVPGKPIGPAVLSPAAQGLLADYTFGPAEDNVACLICAANVATWYPLDMVLTDEQDPVDLGQTTLFRVQPSLEISALTDIELTAFTQVVSLTQITRPEQVDTLMRGLRDYADETLASDRRDEAELDWRLIREGIPPELWEQYFGDVLLYRVNLPLVVGAQ